MSLEILQRFNNKEKYLGQAVENNALYIKHTLNKFDIFVIN